MSGGGRTSLLPMWFFCGAVMIALAVVMRRSTGTTNVAAEYWVWPLLSGLVVLTSVPIIWWTGRGSSGHTVNQWSHRSRRNDGVASRWAIWRVSSATAMRRQATVLRPSLKDLSWWERRRVPVTEFATVVARVGRTRLWSSIEEVTIRVGGPRMGKTGELCCRILDAPGAVIATSTRMDLIEHTAWLRAEKGPVRIFNPSGVGGVHSTLIFDPLIGCENPGTAMTRATDLMSGTAAGNAGDGGGDREFWSGQGRRVLALLMHAAALGDASMRDVLSWVAAPNRAGKDVQTYLRRSPAAQGWADDAAQFLDTNDRTQSSICATIMPALAWLQDPYAIAATTDGDPFDVEELLATSGTVYMLGAEEAQTAPLVTALTGHIAREARRIAATFPQGRLDSPLTMALDEAALICPIPLDSWTADMGGRGVTIHIAAQSLAQLRKRWGDNGAGAILNNAAVVMALGGMRDTRDLAAFSDLAGERQEQVPMFGMHSELTGYTTQRVPVLSQGQIAQLETKRAVIYRRGMATAIGSLGMVWDRRDYKAMQRKRRCKPVIQKSPPPPPMPRPPWTGAGSGQVIDGEVVDVPAQRPGVQPQPQPSERTY